MATCVISSAWQHTHGIVGERRRRKAGLHDVFCVPCVINDIIMAMYIMRLTGH